MVTIRRMVKRHPNTIVLAIPKRRALKSKRVKTWKILQTISNIADCEKLVSDYEKQGYCDVVPISTHLQEVDIPTRLVAKFWRVYFGMQ